MQSSSLYYIQLDDCLVKGFRLNEGIPRRLAGACPVPPLRYRRAQGAQYRIINRCREAPPCGRVASQLPLPSLIQGGQSEERYNYIKLYGPYGYLSVLKGGRIFSMTLYRRVDNKSPANFQPPKRPSLILAMISLHAFS